MSHPYAIAISQHGPTSGPFVCEFALPQTAPAVLRGPNGEVAARIGTVGTESARYAMVTVAEALAPFVRHVPQVMPMPAPLAPGEQIYDLPIAEWPTNPPAKTLSPALLEHVMEIVPTVSYLGESLTMISQIASGTSLAHDAIECLWRLGNVVLRGWGTAFAGLPWMRWRFVGQTADGQGLSVPLDIRWPSAVRVPVPCVMSIDLLGIGVADAVVELAWTLESGPYATLSAAARQNGGAGPWLGVAHEWPGAVLGWPVVKGTRPVTLMVNDLIASGIRAPWALEENPNSPGAHQFYGSTWTAPVWRHRELPDPRVLRMTLHSARSWADRPIHLLEPGSTEPVRFDASRALDAVTNNQQPHDQVSAVKFGVGLIYKGPNRAGKRPFDSEHRGFTLVAFAAAYCGDEIAQHFARTWLGSELYEISMSPGWPERWRGIRGGRDTGRTISCAGLCARVTQDEHLIESWNTASKRRSQAIADFMRRGSRGPVVTTKLETSGGDPKWGPNAPFTVPYETSVAAASQWEEWQRIGNPVALRNAYELGRSVSTAAFPVDSSGDWDLAYWQLWRDGEAPRSAWDLTGMNEAFEKWGGAGLIVYVLAEQELRRLDMLSEVDVTHDKHWLPWTKRAIPGLAMGIDDVAPAELLPAAHSSLFGAFPELVHPVAPA